MFSTQNLSKDTATDVDTNLRSYVQRFADADHSEYSVPGLTPPTEDQLIIGHAKGKAGEDRHLIRFNRTEVDGLLVPATLSVYLNIIRPQSTALTNTVVIEVINRLVDFLIEGGANANVVSIMNGEF